MKMKLLHLLGLATLLPILLPFTEGTLDLSNLDLGNVKFFKYPQLTRTGELIYGRHQPFNIIDPFDNYNRVKAMMTYFADVLFGGVKYKREIAVYFNPDAGAKSRSNFRQKYGNRGEKLVAALGNAFNTNGFVHRKQWRK
ncbi:hypothetical protein Bhyg_09069 [Pseudolycoriella hygida]|uniref:LAGLIDADG homing endonuclease n=1 Tax=Pseudolycoriella hygida TaxID=35572 RepID=A0A9Q0N5T2_9DIPT|nr:hypothetical protein Bhyg_09069 [Pseudolycoriella hygida]